MTENEKRLTSEILRLRQIIREFKEYDKKRRKSYSEIVEVNRRLADQNKDMRKFLNSDSLLDEIERLKKKVKNQTVVLSRHGKRKPYTDEEIEEIKNLYSQIDLAKENKSLNKKIKNLQEENSQLIIELEDLRRQMK